MINQDKKKNPMPSQALEERIENFSEVALGYTEDMAVSEAMRCLSCRKKPCMGGCPAGNDIPAFVSAVSKGEFEEAYLILNRTTSLPSICGRVCPKESQCEGNCILGKKGQPLAIGSLERFVSDWYEENIAREKNKIEKNGFKIAVIGSGPAGISCAESLSDKGYDVTCFEAFTKPGGVLVYGIPKFRLPKDIVEKKISVLKEKGVCFLEGEAIGEGKTVNSLLKEGYDAVFIGNGAGIPMFMGIEGEDLEGVVSASEYLNKVNMTEKPNELEKLKADKVIVVGGGNVAMDAARTAVRMGSKDVTVVYRRSRDEMPAYDDEIEEALLEGVNFKLLTNPVKVTGEEGKVTGIECVEMKLSEMDTSGRRRPVAIKDSNFTIEADQVIMAIGTRTDKSILNATEGLTENQRGGIYTDENAFTLKESVYAGGDAVTGPKTVVSAMKQGRTAAESIDKYFRSK